MGSTRSIHLSLVNGSDGRQLKSQQLTIDANKLFEAQIQIRQQVMALLDWKIPPALNQQFAAQKPAFDGAYKHYLQGQGYLYRFDHDDNINKALGAFQTAIDLDPNYADAYVGLAEAQRKKYIKTKDSRMLKPMVKTVERLMKVDIDHRLLSYLQGELMLSQGKYLAAIKLFEDGIELQDNFFMSYLGLSNSYLQLGQLIRAEQILLNAYQLMPNNNTVLIELGAFYFENGNYHRAIDYFELLAKQAPNNYIAYLNLSACHYLNGDMNQAILSAEKSLLIQPNADGYANLGTYYFILKNYDKAVESYEQMIILNDSDYINWGNLADSYRFTNDDKYKEAFQRAIKLAEQAIELNPNDKYTIASLAYYHANLGDIEKTHFYAVQITAKDTGEDLFFIAAAYARLHMNSTALNYLEFALNNNYSIAEISTSPLLEGLKNESRFQQIINKN
jgi:serine/threonine-protein kinase